MKRKHGVSLRGWCGQTVVMLALAGFAGASWAAEKKPEADELWTNTYVVPPNIHRLLDERAKEIAEQRKENHQNREGLKESLMRCGVKFPEGASVVYNPSTSQVIIRNIKEQMPIVESLIDSLIDTRNLQVFVTIKEVRFNPDELKKEGGDRKDDLMDLLLRTPPSGQTPPDGATGSAAALSEEALRKEMSRPPGPLSKKSKESGILGVFTDPQFQFVLRSLSQHKDVEILTAPSVMVRSGQAGLSRVDQKRWGVAPVIGGDELTINLGLFFPAEGEALNPENQTNISIYSGQTVAYRDRVSEDEVRFVFVTAKLVDPAGLEVKERKEKKVEDNKVAPVHSKPAAQIEKERQAVREADRIGLRGYDKLLAGDFKGAVSDFEAALKKLPEDSEGSTRSDSLKTQLAKARAELKTQETPIKK